MTHVAKDLTVVGLLSLVGIWLYAAHLPLPVALVAWPVFWFVQVCVGGHLLPRLFWVARPGCSRGKWGL